MWLVDGTAWQVLTDTENLIFQIEPAITSEIVCSCCWLQRGEDWCRVWDIYVLTSEVAGE